MGTKGTKGKGSNEPRRDAAAAPGGAAQFDPAQQTHRKDMETEPLNGEGEPMRGTIPPKSGRTRHEAQAPAVPGSDTDRGEKPARDGQRGT
jgi:hypothetical protein